MPETTAKKPFSLLIKPASADCNLACDYCFYRAKSSLYRSTLKHRMSEKCLQRVIASYMGTEQAAYSFAWQGGEPTLMGREFFRKVVELQNRYGKPGAGVVANSLQTNATLITDELAELFAEHGFFLGVSLDGPQAIHDVYRRNGSGNGSHRLAMKGIEILRKHGVDFNVLIAVNAANGDRPAEIYRYLVDNGAMYHQYIPIVEFDDHGDPLAFSVRGEQWGRFLNGIYDQWLPDAGRVSVRLFDSILASLVNGASILCTMGRDCRQYLVVEHNGDVYPCDFFVLPELRLGNILRTDWRTLLESRNYEIFGRGKSRWNSVCDSCPYIRFCSGDCLKHRIRAGRGPDQLSWLCEGWKAFYSYALPGLQRIGRRIQRQAARNFMTAAQGNNAIGY
jgi:uncharacterized protein